MQIVTDSGTDITLTKEEQNKLNIHVVPLNVSLDGITYREGLDIQPADFYSLLEKSEGMPSTSQPSSGEFADTYRKILETDRDILSIHITSAMSGTYNAALTAAAQFPEANITVLDTKTLSAAAGWQVVAAARAVQRGWSLDQVKSLVTHINEESDSIYTLNELKYLIHGGRISNLKGILASVLNIKPLIGVDKVNGIYEQLGQVRTFKRAVESLVNIIKDKYPAGTALRVQILHAFNFAGAEQLRDLVDKDFNCTWLPEGHISLVLGAHTGPSMIGVAFAPQSVFAELE
ncbi:MAG: DegV family protein [Chloroflexota bacterium]|nr:MAG: DegV family protein [Chloroflexota bacterium]